MNTSDLSSPGTLIRARNREWIVLPGSSGKILMVRPVGGLDEEITGILTDVDAVESATFSLPSPTEWGDASSCRLLREAARLSTRSAAGPFRSFGRIAVEPRPYQLVPLMMALKMDPVRMLIADDVGIGKTIEAILIARELLDRGEIRNMAVLCPPHLAEQWQQELYDKFHIEAELVLSSTIQRLERDLPHNMSVFDRHPFTVISTDFVKSTHHAEEFICKCPEFVIVDEAHTCTLTGGVGRGRQQRFDLVKRLAEKSGRHLVLVTATPHSGNEDAFRSLLSLLDPEFVSLPTDLDRAELDSIRRKLARHLVQRRRVDIRQYLETSTFFPERKDREVAYSLSGEYRSLLDDVLAFAREYVSDSGDTNIRQRVRYWSALALMRCISSSPAAAAATLRNRARTEQAGEDEIDDLGRRTVLDQDDPNAAESQDLCPGAGLEAQSEKVRSRMLAFAKRAEKLPVRLDEKLQGAIREVKQLLQEGFHPVVFCRFVDTAEYVARHLRTALPGVRVEAVTGLLPPSEREQRIEELVEDGKPSVLVCTDCLSEGINLQQHFHAVFHYDLAWNPTRHEQREGRVDRFGQERPEVRVVTYYGANNPIDGVILDVLLKKHKKIKNDLGVAVAVPGTSEQVAEALFEGSLFRKGIDDRAYQPELPFFVEEETVKAKLHGEWESAKERESRNRSRFAQHSLSPEAVADELQKVREAIGRNEDVEAFFRAVMQAVGVPQEEKGGGIRIHLEARTPRALRQALGRDESFAGRFDLPLKEGEIYLGRTSPIIEGLAGWILDQALDRQGMDSRDTPPIASRSGIMRTEAVSAPTTLLLARFRYHIVSSGSGALLSEEIVPLACTGRGETFQWLPTERSEEILKAKPSGNMLPTAFDQQKELLLATLPGLQKDLEEVARSRGDEQLAAHRRVRESYKEKKAISIEPVLPVDILGAYRLIPGRN